MNRQTLASIAAVTLIASNAGCATDIAVAPPPGAQALSAAELRNLIERASVEGRLFDDGYEGGLTYAFRADGRIIITSRYIRNQSVSGRWRVELGQASLCTHIEPDPESCTRIYRLPGQGNRYYADVEGGTLQANTFLLR